MNKSITRAAWALAFAALPLASATGAAEGSEDSKPLICATTEAIECAVENGCTQGRADRINAPQWVRLDLQAKSIHARRPDGSSITTDIQSMTDESGQTILQGVENGRGWSLALTRESGQMVLTATGEQAAFILFGTCLPPNLE